MDEPIVATDYSMSIVRTKMKHYKIFLGVTFLAFLACLVLLIVSIAVGFGCYTTMAHTPMNLKRDSMKFLHVSDVHLDLYYNSTTSKKSFCRSMPNTLNITPVSAPFTAPYGRVGCDSPQALLQSSLNFMKKLSSNVDKSFDFILLTGDQVAHAVEKGFVNGTTEERVLRLMNGTTSAFGNMFPNIPFLPSFGNNDLPGDYVLPKDKTFYEKVLKIWKPRILCSKCSLKVTTEEELEKTFLNGGYYKAEVPDAKLVLLQLNTNYWNVQGIGRNPFRRTFLIADAQLRWVEEQLKSSNSSGKKVIISGHIPPGIDGYSRGSHGSFWAKNYTQKYIGLVTNTYKDVVIGQLFGHIHKDDIRLQMFKDTDKVTSDKVSFLLTAPGITPLYRNNPGFRLVTMDKSKSLLADYEQYFMDLVLTTQMKHPVWLFDYSFNDKYMKHLPKERQFITGSVMAEITESLVNQTVQNEHWQTYIQHRQVNYQPDSYSRFKLYCVIKHVTKTAFDECDKKHPVTGG